MGTLGGPPLAQSDGATQTEGVRWGENLGLLLSLTVPCKQRPENLDLRSGKEVERSVATCRVSRLAVPPFLASTPSRSHTAPGSPASLDPFGPHEPRLPRAENGGHRRSGGKGELRIWEINPPENTSDTHGGVWTGRSLLDGYSPRGWSLVDE